LTLQYVRKTGAKNRIQTTAVRQLTLTSQQQALVNSLELYSKAAWEILEPATPLEWNWHHSLICEALTLVTLGRTKRLLINVMPRNLKSFLVSVAFPTWEWLNSPYMSYLCMSFATPLANDHSYRRRQIIESDWYQGLSQGKCILADDRNRITEYSNNSQGVIYARGLDGAITGLGSLRQIYDDPNNPAVVESDSIRESTLKKFKDYSITRRNSPKHTAIIVCQQRTHEEDVSGFIMSRPSASQWTVVKLPTRSPEHKIIVFPITGIIIERQPEELLHPERFGEAEDQEALEDLGSYMYSARHDQEPAPLKGGLLDLAYFRRYNHLPHRFDYIVQTLDTASTNKETSANWAGLTIGAFEDEFYIFDAIVEKFDYPSGKRTFASWALRHRPHFLLIENKSTGTSLIQEYQLGIEDPTTKQTHKFNIVPILPVADKFTRMNIHSGAIQAGRVWLPSAAPWLSILEMSFRSFPKGIKDPVDALSQFLAWEHSSKTTEPNVASGATTGRTRIWDEG
jgi:predicted phage terminase large subunit-like protein